MTLTTAVREAMQGKPEQIQPGVNKAEFVFSETFAGFAGHFSNNPILPGIAQIIAAALTAHPDGPSHIRQIRGSKFVSLVRPGEIMTVEARFSEAEGNTLVNAECYTNNGVCAKIKLVLTLS